MDPPHREPHGLDLACSGGGEGARELTLYLSLYYFANSCHFCESSSFTTEVFSWMWVHGRVTNGNLLQKYRRLRRQARESSGKSDHHEGMSSDDELSPGEMMDFQENKGEGQPLCNALEQSPFTFLNKMLLKRKFILNEYS